MTLSDLKAFMVERRRASLNEISIHFGTSASAARLMLDQWIAKGRIRQLEIMGGCGKVGTGCACKHKPSEVFEWVI